MGEHRVVCEKSANDAAVSARYRETPICVANTPSSHNSLLRGDGDA